MQIKDKKDMREKKEIIRMIEKIEEVEVDQTLEDMIQIKINSDQIKDKDLLFLTLLQQMIKAEQ